MRISPFPARRDTYISEISHTFDPLLPAMLGL
jgi:hypothetical protein